LLVFVGERRILAVGGGAAFGVWLRWGGPEGGWLGGQRDNA